MSAPSPADMPGATEARLAALEADLTETRLALWRERALRRHPQLEPVADMLTGDDEAAILATADRLAARLARRP